MPLDSLLTKMIGRGDTVAITQGKLNVCLASGKPFTLEYHEEYGQQIESEIFNLLGVIALRYAGFSVGNFSDGKYSGVTLQFVNDTGLEAYACFNVTTTHKRNGKGYKKGSPLKSGQFTVTNRHEFYKFWCRLGLPEQPRYYDRMGKLSQFIFTGDFTSGDKLKNKSLKALQVSYEQIKSALLPVVTPPKLVNMPTTNERLSNDQAATKERLTPTTKETEQSHTSQGMQPNLSTGDSNYGNKVIREHGYKGNVISLSTTAINNDIIDPSKQTNDEWLDDFCSD